MFLSDRILPIFAKKFPTREKVQYNVVWSQDLSLNTGHIFPLLSSPFLAYKNVLAMADNLCRELVNPNSFFFIKLLIYCHMIFNIRSVCVCVCVCVCVGGGGGVTYIHT